METILVGKVFHTILSPEGMLALFGGMAVGYIIGILPAVGQGFALILLLPLAFLTRPEIAFIVYASMFGGADLGGSVTSILMNVPGNAGNVATTLDGYPMARAGEAGRAIGLSAGSSIMGTVVGIVALVAVMPLMRTIMYAFGSREYFLTVVLATVIVALATGYGRFGKGLVSICLGMFFSFMGSDVVYGSMRFTGGIDHFTKGVSLVTFIIGLYAISELVLLQAGGESIAQEGVARARLSDTLKGVWEAFRSWRAVVKASLVGVLIGCIPGMGGSVVQYASYSVAKITAKDRSRFGKGEPIGVIACEASNNARDGASMLPTLFLGIPGGPELAILLGIFLIFGITPGPGMGMKHMDLVWTIIICLMLGNVVATVLSILGAPLLSRITTMPISLVTAFTVPLCIVSLLSSNPEIWDLGTAGVLGVIGILMKRTGYPVAPVVIGFVLAPLTERSFHSTLQSSFYSPFAFFQSRLSIGLSIAIVLGVALCVILALKNRHGRNPDSSDDWGEEAAVGSSSVETLLMSGLFFILSLIMVIWAPRYGLRESGLLPLTIGIVMLASSSVVLGGQVRKWMTLRARSGGALLSAELRGLSRDWSTLFPPLAWTILYLAGMIILGTHVSNLVGVFLLLRLLGRMSFAKSFLWSLGVHASILLFFVAMFKMVLWPGAIPLIIPNVLGGGELPSFF